MLGFVAMISGSLAFTNDDPIYKNLKVLPKRTTRHQMDSIMQHFTVSLNVKCNFCHVRKEDKWDFASDDNKHKLVARNMMKMTDKINKKYFDVTGGKGLDAHLMVTCYTCHNGRPEPLTGPVKPRSDTTRR
jgi:hypothetical protein